MAFRTERVIDGEVARITLAGELDASVAAAFKEAIEEVAASAPKRLVLDMRALDFMASAGLRVLVFAKQKMGAGVDIHLVGCQAPVRRTLEMSGFHHSVYLRDTDDGL